MMERDVGVVAYRTGDQLQLLGSRDGSLESLSVLGQFGVDWTVVDETTARCRQLLRHATDSATLTGNALEEIELLGGILLDELLSFDAKRWLAQATGRLTLVISPELTRIPWELMADRRGFLAERWSIGRVVQGTSRLDPLVDTIDAASRASVARPTRVLIIADPDGALPDAYQEGLALHRALSRRPATEVTFRSSCVDAAALRRGVRECDILHFAGHHDERGWRMYDSWFTARDVRCLAGGRDLPRLVVANACRTADGGPMLDAWVEAGVRHLVGAHFEIPDLLGAPAILGFYDRLWRGEPIGDALRGARTDVSSTHGRGAIPWASHVLYGSPGACLRHPVPGPRGGPTRSSAPDRRPTGPRDTALASARSQPAPLARGEIDPRTDSAAPISVDRTNLALVALLTAAIALCWLLVVT